MLSRFLAPVVVSCVLALAACESLPEKNAAYEAEAETWEAAAEASEAQAEVFVRAAAGFVLLEEWEVVETVRERFG